MSNGLLDEYRNNRNRRGDSNKSSSHHFAEQSDNIHFKLLLFIVCIICGNIGSGYTTFWGIQDIIEQLWVALIITIAVQGMMTATALIITSKQINNLRIPFLIMYLVPMIVSIGFNYIYFHAKFTKVTFERNYKENEIIALKNLQEELFRNASTFLAHTKGDIKKKSATESIEKEQARQLKENELTDEYSQVRKGKAGPLFRKYQAEEIEHREAEERLNSLLNNIKTKEKEAFQLMQNSGIESLQSAYQVIVEIATEAGEFSTKYDAPDFPRLEPKKKLEKGEKHDVYEAFKSLFSSPTLFEWISLFLAILMDFVIFIWVIVALIYKINIREFAQ